MSGAFFVQRENAFFYFYKGKGQRLCRGLKLEKKLGLKMVVAIAPVNPTIAQQYDVTDGAGAGAPKEKPSNASLDFSDPKVVVLLVLFGILLVLSAYAMYRRYKMNRLLDRVSMLSERRAQLLDEKARLEQMAAMAYSRASGRSSRRTSRRTKKRKKARKPKKRKNRRP